MANPISNEIRERIIRHKLNQETQKNIAKWLLISESSVTKVWRLYKRTGSIEPQPKNSGRKPRISDNTMTEITEKIKAVPDVTLNELIDEFSLPISAPALSKRLKKIGLTYKKRHCIQKIKNVQMSFKKETSGEQIKKK